MEPDRLLSRVALAIRAGGQETLHKPPVFGCSDQTHEPFRLGKEPVRFADDDGWFLAGTVRTSGGQFDGDRTDVHDVLSLVWAALLRAFGLGSALLIDEPHMFVPGELGARHLVLTQCPWVLREERDFVAARKSMNAWTAFGFHLLDGVFDWSRGGNLDRPFMPHAFDPKKPAWAEAVSRLLRHPRETSVSHRTFPLWIYWAAHDRGVSVVRMPKVRIARLKLILGPFQPSLAQGEDAIALFANGIPNAVPYSVIEKAKKVLERSGDGCADVLTLPIDSHCLFIGDKTVVAVRADCGRKLFERERGRMLKRRALEDHVFFVESTVEWKLPISAGDFEDLCVELLRREPGVVRAKSVGSVNDRDGGRDILIDWAVPQPHAHSSDSSGSGSEGDMAGGVRTIRAIAQVKSRSKSVAKRDVQDIRDTLEHHRADAFLLIAHPRISTALVDHLDDLRRRSRFRVEWWEMQDIESRLRRHPDVAGRYPNLLELRPIAGR